MKIKQYVYDEIIAHARREAPIEACGYLAIDSNGHIVKHYELTNVDRSPEHFSFDPKEQFEALRKARGDGLTIGAVYHNHPRTPARPSPEDIKLANDPAMIYVITSTGATVELKAHKIRDGLVTPQDLEVIE